jgi:rhamnogalacturonyl hydrolase YesR
MQRNSWEQGVAAQAFLELGDSDLVILMAKEAVNRQHEDGRLALMRADEAFNDPASNGEAVLYAARVTGDARLSLAAEKMRDYLLHRAPKTPDGIMYHLGHQVWIDAMYMSPPFLAAVGHPAEALKQIEGFRRRLWDAENKLYAHMWDEDRNDFARRDFWGVGNGWTAAGLTRVIRALPDDLAQEKARLIGYVRDLLDGCLAYLRPDGLFHNVVDDPASFVETNLSQMLAYAIYRGLQGGWLDAAYRGLADGMRAAAHAKVDQYGLVQDVCGAPEFNHPGTAPEGQAFFLLMEAAAAEV